MSDEHRLTETITQRHGQSSLHLECSCGLLIDVKNLRKLPLRAARKQLDEMHKNKLKPKTGSKIVMHDEKKQEPIVETPIDKFVADIEDAAEQGEVTND